MSALSRDEVAHVAMLARIQLTDEELDRLAGQLDQIVGFVATVGEIATDDDIPPMSHNVPMTNVTRPDEVGPSLDRDEVLGQAPAVEQERFRVPRILDEE